MFFVKIGKQKKYLCLVLTIVMILLGGFDGGSAEVKAGVLPTVRGEKETASYIPKGAWVVNRDACTEELLGIQEINSYMDQCGSIRARRGIDAAAPKGTPLERFLLYSKAGMVPIHTGCLCCSVIVGYVHRQDGKKDSIII
ncbi:MAG: hypothetical protein Q4C91_16275 [Eubacteriales bacterium]|nr:hypothetical protein [Eubacteriales bacterium]